MEVDATHVEVDDHAHVRAAIAFTLHDILESADRGVALVCGTLVVGVLFESLDEGTVRLTTTGFEGRLDIVVECREPDDGVLDRYQSAGVREYWCMDVRHDRLTIHRLRDGEMVAVVPDPDGYSRSRLLRHSVRLFSRPPRNGIVRYRLEYR